MTHEQTKHIIEVEQAYVDGKEIEFRMLDSGEKWRVTKYPDWNWENYDYRIKPTPIEGWINVYSDGSTSSSLEYPNGHILSGLFATEKEALLQKSGNRVKTIKVREVEK